ncbi:Sulfotransferase family protein [compost metagenome]
MKSSSVSPITFVFVAHGGELEVKAAILACSLRRAFGYSISIIAAQPVSDHPRDRLSDASLRLFRSLSIPLWPIENPFGSRYPIGNKFAALALGPESGHTLFLDSDMICLSAFDLDSLRAVDAALKPADMALVCREPDYWQRLYTHAGLDLPDARVVTTCTEEVMPAYFNAGFIFVRNARYFASRWLAIAQSIDGDEAVSHKMPWLDQLALPVALQVMGYRVKALDERFNFPLHLKPLQSDPSLPMLCHYHDFGSLLRESKLLEHLKALMKSFQDLRDVLAMSAELQVVLSEASPSRAPATFCAGEADDSSDLVITGIPRSGTSYLCRLMSELPDTVVLNEPPRVLELLNSMATPWGLARFYGELRRDILAGKPVPNKHRNGRLVDDTAHGNDQSSEYFPAIASTSFRLGTKNTLGYLTRLPLIRKVMPKATFIAAIRHPYDTLSSWSGTFEHLRRADVESQPVGNPDDPCLTGWERKSLLTIAATESLPVRRALWWRFLALRLEECSDFVQVLRYEDLVENPKAMLESCMNGSPLLSAERRSWRKGLTSDEQDLVANIVCDVAERFHYNL